MGQDAPVETVARTGCWVARTVGLPLRLGEFALGRVRFPALVLDEHFSRLIGGPASPELPFDRFPRGILAAYAPSYPVPHRLPRLTRLNQAIRYVPAQYQRHYVQLDGTFDSYLEKFSAKSRSTLRKKVRKFAEFSGGAIAWRTFQERDELEEFHRLAFPLSETTYQARLLASGLPDAAAFRRELAAAPSARGYLLFHQDRPIAYIFCPERDGNLLYEHVGYDPEYQQWSPGTVLQYLVLEALFAEGRFRTFDFTEGEGPHKEFFANRSTLCADLYFFRRSPRSLGIIGLHAGLHGVSRASVRVLDRLGLKARIKKLLRAGP